MTEMLTTAEAARRLSNSPYQLREKAKAGFFIEGEHYVRPPRSRLRWFWPEVTAAFAVKRPEPAGQGTILARGRKVA